jgi:hypothetical protein
MSLRREDRKAVGRDVKTAQYGWPLGMPLIRKLEAGLWEVRSHIGDGIQASGVHRRRRRDGAATRLRQEVGEDADGRPKDGAAAARQATRSDMMNKQHVGGDFDDFLRDERFLDDAEATAAKRVIAFQIAEEMKRTHLTKSEMAQRMKTSRPALDRLLDPKNRSVTLSTLERAAAAVGKKLRVELT